MTTEVKSRYDAIVIGSGIGGLMAANFLAHGGADTLLVERHYAVGGYLQGGWRRGFYFDYATQSYEVRGPILPSLQRLGLDDRVEFKKSFFGFVSPSDGLDYSLHSIEDAVRAFHETYPESDEGLRQYFEYFRGATDVARELNVGGLRKMVMMDCAEFMPDYHAFWKQQPYYKALMEYDAELAWRKARGFLGKSRVARILTHFGYRNQSAFATGLFWHYWCEDTYYNEGGKQVFMDMLADAFQERGGTLLRPVVVDEILVEGATARGVRLADGRVVKADIVVSNADLLLTFKHLLRNHPAVEHLTQQAEETPGSETFFTVYLGTSIPVEELREALKGAAHTWVFPTHKGTPGPFDIDFHSALPMEISAPVINEPGLANRGSCLVLQVFSFFDWMNAWKVSPEGKRRREYRQLKDLVERQLIDNAAIIIPGLRERITYRASATPLTHVRYTWNKDGASAGWTWNPRRTMVKLTDQCITTPIKNLLCASHWVLYPGGALTAALAGKIAADVGLATLSGRVAPEMMVANVNELAGQVLTP